MNAAKTASRRNLLPCTSILTKRIANAIAKTIERINNTIERFSLSIQITIYLAGGVYEAYGDDFSFEPFCLPVHSAGGVFQYDTIGLARNDS